MAALLSTRIVHYQFQHNPGKRRRNHGNIAINYKRYISFISGVSQEKIADAKAPVNLAIRERSTILLNSLLFILGFSLVFIILGASATRIGSFFTPKISFFTKIAGLIIIFFGVIKIGIIEKISGLILVIVGLMIFFNKFILIPGYLSFLNRFIL